MIRVALLVLLLATVAPHPRPPSLRSPLAQGAAVGIVRRPDDGLAAGKRAGVRSVTAALATGPGYGDAWPAASGLPGAVPEADGRVRAIVLLAGRPGAAARLAAAMPGMQVRRHLSLIAGLAVRVEPGALPALRHRPDVRAVYADARLEAALADSGPIVGAPEVWARHDPAGRPATGTGVRVAILDTGVDYTHPALGGCLGAGCKVAGGYDFVHDDADPRDGNGHGTHVAGIVAADGLLRGIAPGATLLAYQVLAENCAGYASDVIAGLERAVADGADVINLSLGGPGSADDPVSLAARAAADAGCVVVASAGNLGPGAGSVTAPGVAPGVLAVAAVDKAGLVAGWSSRGPAPGTFAIKPDLAAPGVAISSTVPADTELGDPGGWLPASGTSMAAPHVAGGAALLRQLHPDWPAAEVAAALVNYAADLGGDLFAAGAGRLWLPAAASAGLIARPASLSFGLPVVDGTRQLTVTVRNVSTAPLAISPSLAVEQVADGAGRPLAPARPVTYAAAAPAGLSLAPGAAGVVTVTVDAPPGAADGYYQGRLYLGQAAVPLAFALLSRVTLRVVDVDGAEIAGWGHLAVLASVPAGDVVAGNAPLRVPAQFVVPAGEYYAQAFGRFGLYDHLLIPGLEPQVPYAAIRAVTIAAGAAQTVTLSLAETRTYWLDAAGAGDNGPAFINAWAAAFRYAGGGEPWLARLGQSYVRVLSTDLPAQWPAGFALRLSDTPPGVSFSLALQSAGFSGQYRDFVRRHGAFWPADRSGRMGLPVAGSADRLQYLAWEYDGLGAGTPPSFTVPPGPQARLAERLDVPGVLGAPWLGWEPAGEAWLHPASGAGSGLEPAPPGLARSLTIAGPHQAAYWAGGAGGPVVFEQPLYTVDWAATVPWAGDPAVSVPDAARLTPLEGERAAVLGAGPAYPGLALDNLPDAVQMRHPLLVTAGGAAVTDLAAPSYALALDGRPVAAGALPEHNLTPFPVRRWADLPAGRYTLAITPTLGPPLLRDSAIRAGFSLTAAPGADLDPPQFAGLDLAQRYDPAAALTVTWTVSDAGPAALAAALRRGESGWAPLAVEPAGEGRFRARVEPAGALTLTLAYTATDAAGNWLSGRSTAAAARPATLAFALDPPRVPWTRRPVTVWLRGSLRGAGDQPLAGSPAWLALSAGGQLAGYVRDLTGCPGRCQTGEILFPWTFVPADLAARPGPLPVSLALDLGIHERQVVTQTLFLAPPLYLPLVARESAP